MTSEEREEFYVGLKECIIATDLVLYFKYRAKCAPLVEQKLYDWDNPDHRHLGKCIMCTACDFSYQVKDFYVTEKYTDALYGFYNTKNRRRNWFCCSILLFRFWHFWL